MSEWTLYFDYKTGRPTTKMSRRESPLHIVSAQVAELGITIGQQTVDEKSNEIPAVRDLIKELNIKDCMIVTDAMHCQRETAGSIKTVVKSKKGEICERRYYSSSKKLSAQELLKYARQQRRLHQNHARLH